MLQHKPRESAPLQGVDQAMQDSLSSIVILKPTYSLGDAEMNSTIKKNVVYPKNAKNVMVTVLVAIEVDAQGNATSYKIARSAETGMKVGLSRRSAIEQAAVETSLKHSNDFDAEALRVAKLFKKFSPGTKNGVAIASVKTISIPFKQKPTLKK